MLHDPNDAALFPRLSEEQREWLGEHGTEVRLEPGELLFSEEEPPRDFFVVLEGEIRVTKRLDGEETLLALHGPGEFTGDVSLVTNTRVTATAHATEVSRLCRIEAADFERVVAEHPSVAGTVYRAVAGRSQELSGQMQGLAKLASLGTMAAGLAHELNNPAAAARRASDRLTEVLLELPRLSLALVTHHLSPEQQSVVLLATLNSPRGAPASPENALERSDREDALADWLEAQGVADAWGLAPTFLDGGLDHAGLAAILEQTDPGAATDVLAWLGASLEARSLSNEIGQGTARLSELVGAMKGYAHLDQTPLQEVDVHEGLESTLTILGYKLRDVTVTRNYDRSLPRIWARGGELNQVWTNLIDNAVDAAGDGGKLSIRTRREDERALVEIGDDGPGIPEEVQERIFEPFFTTKGVGQGTGLGLDIARRIVVGRHGGTLQVLSEPGDTRFQVRLPITKQDEQA